MAEVTAREWEQRVSKNSIVASAEADRLIALIRAARPDHVPVSTNSVVGGYFRASHLAPFMPVRPRGKHELISIIVAGQIIDVTYAEYIASYYAMSYYYRHNKHMHSADNTYPEDVAAALAVMNNPPDLIFYISAEQMIEVQRGGGVQGCVNRPVLAAGPDGEHEYIYAVQALAVPENRTEIGCDGDNGVYMVGIKGERFVAFVRHMPDGTKCYVAPYVSKRFVEALESAGYVHSYDCLVGAKFRKINAVRDGVVRPRHFLLPPLPVYGHSIVTNKKLDHLMVSGDRFRNNTTWSGVIYC